MTAANVPAADRRAVFVGADAYIEAGGNIIRDLFSEDRGGFFEDAGLLDMLAIEKLREIAGEVQAEGWKWTEAHIDYRSEEHTSELQSLMRNSYAVFCLKKKTLTIH